MHWQHFVYEMRHKWFVLIAGRRLGAPLWRLLIHDWSKFGPCEWPALTRHHAGLPPLGTAHDLTLLHHFRWNPHHWQHWVYRANTGETRAIEMPEHFAREMVADWMGAERAKRNRWDLCEWYAADQAKMTLHPNTRALVERLIGAH